MELFSSLVFYISLFLSFFNNTFLRQLVFNDGLKGYRELKLPAGVTGPESIAFDCNGDGPYSGVSDGRILRWNHTQNQWLEFAVTSPYRDRKFCDGSTDPSNEPICGRPLGLKFDSKTCNLYIADAYFGLLMVGPGGGGAQQLAISANNDASPFKFLNALDIDDQSGLVYFSDSSTVYRRREWPRIVVTGDRTGRLLKYEPRSKKVEVLVQGLAFPNGLALSQDGSFLLLAESSSGKIYKVWLKGSKAYTLELLVQLKRGPDDIKRNKKGDNFWVGLYSGRTTCKYVDYYESLHDNKWWKLEEEDPVGVKFDGKGKAMEILDGGGGQELESVSEVVEHDGRLWVGSVVKDYVAVVTHKHTCV